MATRSPMPETLRSEWPTKLALVTSGVTAFSNMLRREAANEDVYLQAAIESYLSLLGRGGKRTRGILAIVGYEIFGGSNEQAIAAAAGIVEAQHAYLLVMDDVADASVRRRGGPTAHVFMEAFLKKQGVSGNAAKLGIDAAQGAALVAQHKAQSMLLGLVGATAKQKLMAAVLLNEHLARTGVGQILDILAPGRSDIRTEDILKIATYKTAYYSFLLPLQVGAALAGANRQDVEYFTEYAKYAGLTFQLQDDIVGLFGDEAVTGKSRMDDIIEGKRTFLMTTALGKANKSQRAILLSALGDANIQEKDFARCLEVVKSTGALRQTQELVETYVARALESLDKVPAQWPASRVQFLRDIALYSARRRS